MPILFKFDMDNSYDIIERQKEMIIGANKIVLLFAEEDRA